MSRKHVSELKPFFSVLLIVVTLFSVVFLKMEVRQMGYTVLKSGREYKKLKDQYRLAHLEYTKMMSPERLRELAEARLTMGEAQLGQIIQISGENIALRQ